VSIEVTNPSAPDLILDDSIYFEKFSEKMGKPFRTEMRLTFSVEERAEIVKKQKVANAVAEETQKAVAAQTFMPFPWRAPASGLSNTYMGNLFPPMSVKKAFAPFVKKKGFRYLGAENKVYRYEKIDTLHNRLFIELVQGLSSPEIACSMKYQSHCLQARISLPSFLPKSQEDVERFAENVFAAASYMESTAAPKLQPLYGKTPDWFVYGDRT
jgi:hypothetical protein